MSSVFPMEKDSSPKSDHWHKPNVVCKYKAQTGRQVGKVDEVRNKSEDLPNAVTAAEMPRVLADRDKVNNKKY